MNKYLLGFLAGALAIVSFHQIALFLLVNLAGAKAQVWNFAPNQIGVPVLLSHMFWGGLWGVLFAWVVAKKPSWFSLIGGIIFGLLGPMLAAWFIVPLIKGMPFPQLDAARIMGSMFINGMFGLGIAYFMTFFKRYKSCC